jgi:hypothetical protein
VADIGVVIGQFLRLRGDRLGDFLAAIADVDAVEPGEGVEQAVAVTVLDKDALAAGDDPVRHVAARELREMGGGMEKVIAIPLVELIVDPKISGSLPVESSDAWVHGRRFLQIFQDQPLSRLRFRPGQQTQGQACRVLYRLGDDVGEVAGQPRRPGQQVIDQALVAVDVAGDDMEQVIKASTQCPAGYNFVICSTACSKAWKVAARWFSSSAMTKTETCGAMFLSSMSAR